MVLIVRIDTRLNWKRGSPTNKIIFIRRDSRQISFMFIHFWRFFVINWNNQHKIKAMKSHFNCFNSEECHHTLGHCISWHMGFVIRKSCSFDTELRDIYAIRPALVYASTSLVSVPDSICLSFYFLLAIHYH